MEIIAALAASLIGIAIIAAVIAGFFMLIGAKIACVENATLGKSIIAAIASSFITWIVALVFSIVPLIGTIVGFIVGLFLALLAIKGVYNTSFAKALLVWIFNILAQVAAIIIGFLFFAGAIMAAFGR